MKNALTSLEIDDNLLTYHKKQGKNVIPTVTLPGIDI